MWVTVTNGEVRFKIEGEREGKSSSLGMLGLWSPLVESGGTMPLQQWVLGEWEKKARSHTNLRETPVKHFHTCQETCQI